MMRAQIDARRAKTAAIKQSASVASFATACLSRVRRPDPSLDNFADTPPYISFLIQGMRRAQRIHRNISVGSTRGHARNGADKADRGSGGGEEGGRGGK